jgi:endogenous inhibitor of DNA gyrase (YacG/DUF329 family)
MRVPRHPEAPLMDLCERCSMPFEVTHPRKRFCSERCQRAAERERYRARRTESAACPHCGEAFERTTTTKRLKVYCSLECQYEARSAEYGARADIKANLKRAELVRRRKAKGPSAESLVIFS